MVRENPIYPDVRYDFELQPGTYAIVIAAHRVTGAPVDTCYFALSALLAVGCIGLVALLAGVLAGVPILVGLLLALLCQEMQAAAFYANSSTLGGFFGLVGLVALVRGRTWLRLPVAGVCLAVGGWCRLDSLVLAPAVLALLAKGGSIKDAVRRTAGVAIVCVAGLVFLFHVSGISLVQIWRSGTAQERGVEYFHNWIGLGEATSLAMALTVVVGLGLGAIRRDFWVLSLLASVLIPTAVLYAGALWSTKYYYYLVFVMIVVAAYALRRLAEDFQWSRWRQPRALVLLGLGGLGLAELFLSIRSASPQVRQFTPNPTVASVTLLRRASGPVVLAVGAGELVGNSDGFRLRGGLIFAGLAWHGEKARALVEGERVRELIASRRSPTMLTSTYLSAVWATAILEDLGYHRVSATPSPLDSGSNLQVWTDGHRACLLGWINMGPHQSEVMDDYVLGASTWPVVLINDLGPPHAGRLLADVRYWKLLSSRAEGLIAIYAL